MVEPEDDIFLLISPQNLIGASLMPMLEAMADKAGDRPFILLNPNLADRPSSNNLMQVAASQPPTTLTRTRGGPAVAFVLLDWLACCWLVVCCVVADPWA